MIHITDHAALRLAERGITPAEARRVALRGRPVEQRLGGLRLSAMGVTVVLAIEADGTEATIITAWREE